MEIIIEVIFEVIFEGMLVWYTSKRKKKDPDYDNTKFKKFLDIVVKALIVVIIFILILVILTFIEWLFPNLFDIIEL